MVMIVVAADENMASYCIPKYDYITVKGRLGTTEPHSFPSHTFQTKAAHACVKVDWPHPLHLMEK